MKNVTKRSAYVFFWRAGQSSGERDRARAGRGGGELTKVGATRPVVLVPRHEQGAVLLRQ